MGLILIFAKEDHLLSPVIILLSGDMPRTPPHLRRQKVPTSKFSPAFWLTTQRHSLAKTRHPGEDWPLLGLASWPTGLLTLARSRLFQGKLSVSPPGRARLVNSAPQRRRSPMGGGPIHINVDEHGSCRAAWSGNWLGRSLGTNVRYRRPAIWHAAT